MDGAVHTVRPETLGAVILRWAAVQPDAPAFVSQDRAPLTYRALAVLIDDFRQTLNAAGFGRRDRIAIIHPGGADMAACLFGIVSGCTAVPLSPKLTKAEFSNQFRDRGVTGIVIPEEMVTPARDAAVSLSIPVLDLVAAADGVTGSIRPRTRLRGVPDPGGPAEPDDIALILATSGTTSRSKIVPLRHRHIIERSRITADLLGLTPADRCINLNPLSYAGSRVPMILYSGGSIVFLAEFDCDNFFRHLVDLQPTWFQGSFTFQQTIRDRAPDHLPEIEQSCIRFIRTSSGRLDPRIAEDLETYFKAPVIEAYSSTESGRITGNPQPPGARKRGTVGLPVGCEVVILDEEDNRMAPGQRGEVTVRGPGVFDGYENDPEANDAAFFDGWYRTGDEGFFDADGYLTLTGRIKDVINRGGEKISPAEVDAALTAHPDIAEAAVFGISHATLGEIVGAAIVPADGGTPGKRALTRFLSDRLSPFKIPRVFHVVDALPKGPTGKVQRHKLADRFTS